MKHLFDQMLFIMIMCLWWIQCIVNFLAKLSQLMKDAVCNNLMTWNYDMTLTNTDALNICRFQTEATARFLTFVVCVIIHMTWCKRGFHEVCFAYALAVLNMLTLFFKTYNALHYKTTKRLGKCQMYFKTSHLPHARQSLVIYPFSMGQRAEEIVIEGTSAADLMRFEWSRYLSFKTFPQNSVMMPMRLSQAGFYYTGHGEEVKCFCCGVTNGDWTADETAIAVHKRVSPNCAFISVEETNNVTIHSQEYYNDMFENFELEPILNFPNTESLRENRLADNRNNSGTQAETVGQSNSSHSTSARQVDIKHPKYMNVSDRIVSFNERTGLHVHSPRDLAEAGLFYAGVEDYVKCFCCGLGLKDWQKGDNPLREHFRWSPNCQYLKKVLQVQESLPQPTLPINDPVDNAALRRSNSELRRALKSEKEEKEMLKNQLTCKICLENACNTVFLPCGHMAVCQTCAVSFEKCPICRDHRRGGASSVI